MKQRGSAISVLWTIPTLYGVLLLAASAWWLVFGEPFDHGTYERISGSPWQVLTREFTPPQSAVFAAMVRLLGGNGGLMAGGHIIAVAFFGYRTGSTWAWFTLWLLPLHALLDLAIVGASGGWSRMMVVWDVSWAATMIIVLITTYSRFMRYSSTSRKNCA